MNIKTTKEFKDAIRRGPYAWPGGYPIYFLMSDGEALSFKDAKKNARRIIQAIRSKDNTGGWRVVAVDINYEDDSLYSADSGEKIESAYKDNPTKRGHRSHSNPIKPFYYVSAPTEYTRGFGIDAVTPIPWLVHKKKRVRDYTLYFWLPDELTISAKFRNWVGSSGRREFSGSANELKRHLKTLLP